MRSAADAAPSFLYLPELAQHAHELTLARDEARYLARVVRAREGERVTASDGAGRVATLVVERVQPECVLRVESRRDVPAAPAARLVCGAPEGERGDWLVEKIAELGVAEFVPVDTQRVRWPAGLRRERWERLAVAALRQSRAAWLLRVGEPVTLAAAIAATPGGARWLADPGGMPPALAPAAHDAPVTGVVGPSSGFSDDERKLLESSGFVTVRLAAQRLRTETAALALASHWAAHREPSPDVPAAGEP
jgi:16S rRNA (uracil1498-N3)-methyltransferase